MNTMVKRILYILVCVVFCLVSCQDDMGLPTLEPRGDYRIVASMGCATRVEFDGLTLKWKGSERISLVEVDDEGKAVGNLITYWVKKSSISEDGRVAEFCGADLQAGKRYMASYASSVSINHNYGAIGVLFASSSGGYGDLSTTESYWPMTSDVFEVVEGETPTLSFHNHASLLTLRMCMDKDVAGAYALKNVEVSAPANMFCEHVNILPAGRQIITSELSSSIWVTCREDDNATISSDDTCTVYMYFIPNEQLKSVSGDFRISMYTTDFKESMVEVPARLLRPCMSYHKDVSFATPVANAKQDSLILVELYNQTGGENWDRKASWLSDKPIREWQGVRVDLGGRVRALYFSWNEMEGTLPESIGGLEKLEILDLSFNNLSGALPREMGKLSCLKEMYLTYNNFEGAIPKEFGDLTCLQYLNITNCGGSPSSLTSAPKELGNLRNLETLMIEHQELFDQPIPEEWCGMVSLKKLFLDNCGFTGGIPSGLGDLPELKVLELQENKLSGTVPESLIQIDDLNLRRNNLSGVLPFHFYRDQSQWNKLAWRILPQNDGFCFEETYPPVFAEPAVLKTIDGETINTDELYKSNKLTCVLTISRGYYRMAAIVEEVNNLYELYSDRGLGMIAGCSGDEDGIRSYVEEMKIPGDICKLSDENEIKHVMDYVGYSLIDTTGAIVYSQSLYNYDGNPYQKALEVAGEYLGEGAGLYESTDYSADGEVMTLQKATMGDGVNVVFMGDGFADKDMGAGGEYERRMKQAMESFFSEEPYATFRNRFNAYAVKAVSKNEGVGGSRETVFASEFGEGTRVMGDTKKTGDYAMKVSGINSVNDLTVVVVVNSHRSAGTCYMSSSGFSAAFCAIIGNDDQRFREVIHHEAGGHGFAKLADEYTRANYVSTSDDVAELKSYQKDGWYMNVDFTDNPDEIVWGHFLKDRRYDGLVGIYEGAFMFEKGAYRPTYNSIMRYNTGGFNAPSRQAIYKKIMELSGEEYSYEKFLDYDAINRTPAAQARCRAQSTRVDEADFVPFAPPVLLDW